MRIEFISWNQSLTITFMADSITIIGIDNYDSQY